eukprot:2309484-Rhodomonas_salina.1
MACYHSMLTTALLYLRRELPLPSYTFVASYHCPPIPSSRVAMPGVLVGLAHPGALPGCRDLRH